MMVVFKFGWAKAVSAMPRLGCLKLRILTGTGFAQPNLNTTIMRRPKISRCLMGLSVSLPISFAVLSPSLYATKPWLSSCRVMHSRAGITDRSI